jgi:hypothetical protein
LSLESSTEIGFTMPTSDDEEIPSILQIASQVTKILWARVQLYAAHIQPFLEEAIALPKELGLYLRVFHRGMCGQLRLLTHFQTLLVQVVGHYRHMLYVSV